LVISVVSEESVLFTSATPKSGEVMRGTRSQFLFSGKSGNHQKVPPFGGPSRGKAMKIALSAVVLAFALFTVAPPAVACNGNVNCASAPGQIADHPSLGLPASLQPSREPLLRMRQAAL
jgi:hypothetical protein